MKKTVMYETGSYGAHASTKRNPTWRPKMVALDIDGTLVDHDGRLPRRIRAAVRRVEDAGVPVVLSTGRSWHGVEPLYRQLGLRPGPSVASNGAVIVSYPPFEVVHQVTFDPSRVIYAVHHARPEALIAVEEVGQGYRLNGLFPEGDLTGEMTIETIDELVRRPVTRVIIRDPASTDEDFMALANQLGLHGVSYFIGWSAWLDIAPAGVNKATALDAVARSFAIDPADVLAVGDGRNDIEMLQWAGRGVALGDAPDVVKAAADDVAGLFDEGGTATELERWFG